MYLSSPSALRSPLFPPRFLVRGTGAHDAQILNILKTVSQVAQKGMIQMFQHPSFPDDVPDALGPDHWGSSSACSPGADGGWGGGFGE